MSLFGVIASSKFAASALAVTALAVGGAGTAAYANALPAPVQEAAHNLIGAPSPAATVAAGATAAGTTPSVSAPSVPSAPALPSTLPTDAAAKAAAIVGLCDAFAHGGLTAGSAALESLTDAAKGEANITAFCATSTSGAAANANASAAGADASVTANGSATLPSAPAAPAVPSVPSVPSAPALPSPAAGIADQASNALQK